MRFHDLATARQSQPGPLKLADRVEPLEGLKDLLLILGLDPQMTSAEMMVQLRGGRGRSQGGRAKAGWWPGERERSGPTQRAAAPARKWAIISAEVI